MTLHSLFYKLATASSESDLRFSLMDNLNQYFDVQRWGIYLVDEENNSISSDTVGVSDSFIETYRSRQQNLSNDLLTQREVQIARLVACGLTNAEIGREFWISQNTVKQALKKMFLKLNVASRTEMIAKLLSF